VTEDDARAFVDDPAVRRATSAVEAAKGFLTRIELAQPRLRAFVTVTPETALADAARVDAARARGEPLPLDGLPIGVKDNVDVGGAPTKVGSRLFAGRAVAERDAPAVARLRAAGAVVLGKTNLHELAFGATSRNETFGAVVNPWSPERIPGGSSGGSGVAVAADLCAAAVGTDTGGSIRLPAAFCGVSGLRPTPGAVPLEGVFPVAATLDTLGPLARSVSDLAALHGVAAGAETPVRPSVSGLRVGLPQPFFGDDLDPELEAALERAVDVLRSLGASVARVALPGSAEAAEACGALIRAEALAVHEADLHRRPELFEEGTRRRLALATTDPAELSRLRERQSAWRAAVTDAFAEIDLLLCPATPGPPPLAAEADTVATTAAVTPFTFALSLAGVPVVTVPCGFTADGLPLGLQLAGPPGGETIALGAAAAYQDATDWHRARPPAYAGSSRTTS
jgi:aspartyl-tRNA(Asn)/glutamyl-tRNA(Gln) amidotransferase subunit A